MVGVLRVEYMERSSARDPSETCNASVCSHVLHVAVFTQPLSLLHNLPPPATHLLSGDILLKYHNILYIL